MMSLSPLLRPTRITEEIAQKMLAAGQFGPTWLCTWGWGPTLIRAVEGGIREAPEENLQYNYFRWNPRQPCLVQHFA